MHRMGKLDLATLKSHHNITITQKKVQTRQNQSLDSQERFFQDEINKGIINPGQASTKYVANSYSKSFENSNKQVYKDR